jgi:glycerol-3-phosphate acyltransferase PlsY
LPFGICLGAWIIFFGFSRYVSVASIAAAVALPIGAAAWPSDAANRFGLLFWIFLFLGAMAIWKHRINIRRLMDGTEHRAWGSRKETAK